MLIIFFTFILLFHVIVNIVFFIGYIRSRNCIKSENTNLPYVTVLVAARNEENSIEKVINTLKEIDYEKTKFEVIFIDDFSTDKTYSIINENISSFNNFKLIRSQENISANLKGKANAVDTGIKISKGELIFITDADCEVQKNWIKSTVKYYTLEKVSMVCGFTNIKANNSFFTKLQSFDWLLLLSIASCSSGINNIISCIGNNISFRKSVYNLVGGYSKIKFSITEDLALLKEIKKLKNYKILFPVDKDNLVFTKPCNNIKELYFQKKRWFKGGIGLNYIGYLLGIDLYLINITLLTGWIYLPVYLYISIVLFKIISELSYIYPVSINLKLKMNYLFFPLFQIYFALYGLMLPLTFLFGTGIEWKNRKF